MYHLHTVDGQPWSSVQFLMAYVTFEVFGFLVLNKNHLIVNLCYSTWLEGLGLKK